VDTARINDVTDSRQRYERALLLIAAELDARGVPHRLLVDDHRGGDQLALVAEPSGELLELVLHRHGPERGTAWLLVDSPAAAQVLVDVTDSLARRVSRLSTVQRGCLLAVASLARNLVMDGAGLLRGYPHAGISSLRQVFGSARPLVGLRAELRPASVLQDSTARELACGRASAYGAVVPTPHGPRAARWLPAEGGFSLPPAARRELRAHGSLLDRASLASLAIAGPVTFGLSDDPDDERAFDLEDAAECSCDLVELGGFDLASCFDVIPDCAGGIDCVPFDCGL